MFLLAALEIYLTTALIRTRTSRNITSGLAPLSSTLHVCGRPGNIYGTKCAAADDAEGGPQCAAGKVGACCESSTSAEDASTPGFCTTLTGVPGALAPPEYDTCEKIGKTPYCCDRVSGGACYDFQNNDVCPVSCRFRRICCFAPQNCLKRK